MAWPPLHCRFYIPPKKGRKYYLLDWLKKYHKDKGLPLPKGFWKRNTQALLAMYIGICNKAWEGGRRNEIRRR